MTVRPFIAVACALTMISATSFAAPSPSGDLTSVLNEITSDSVLLSGWFSNQLKNSVAFNSTTGNVVPTQVKLLGFEVGVEGMASSTKVDTPALHNLGTQVIDTNQVSSFSRFPFPNILGHAKVGLPFGLDAGIRIGGLPPRSFTSGNTTVKVKNNIFGIDLREKLIDEGMTRPFGVTLGVNYTHATGSIDSSTPYSSQSDVTVNGTTYHSALGATGTGHSTWNTNSLGVQAIMDKQIFFITPYVGASANRNFGSVSTSLGTSGTETLTDPNNSSNQAAASFATNGVAGADPRKWDLRALAGIEFNFLPFLKLGLGAEYGGTENYGGSLGLRFQFH